MWGHGSAAVSESLRCVSVHHPGSLKAVKREKSTAESAPVVISCPTYPGFQHPTIFRIQSHLLFYQSIFPCCSFCWREKKCTTWELWVKVYLRQNEDCSPGDSPSDSSEKVLHRGGGEVSIYVILMGRWVHTVKHTFWPKVSASHREQMLLLMILELF